MNGGFSPDQRRLIWHSDGTKRCSYPGCGVKLDWTNFTIDHIKPFAKGGKTTLKNAALMCKRHNSMKGARLSPSTSGERWWNFLRSYALLGRGDWVIGASEL